MKFQRISIRLLWSCCSCFCCCSSWPLMLAHPALLRFLSGLSQDGGLAASWRNGTKCIYRPGCCRPCPQWSSMSRNAPIQSWMLCTMSIDGPSYVCRPYGPDVAREPAHDGAERGQHRMQNLRFGPHFLKKIQSTFPCFCNFAAESSR